MQAWHSWAEKVYTSGHITLQAAEHRSAGQGLLRAQAAGSRQLRTEMACSSCLCARALSSCERRCCRLASSR